MILSLDLETECAVKDCGDKDCQHALIPWKNRITVVGLADDSGLVKEVYRDLKKLKKRLINLVLQEGYRFTGYNFKFDLLNLIVHEVVDLSWLQYWEDDVHLMAYVCTEKIPDWWIQAYNTNRPKHCRRAGKHSLKTQAPYVLHVKPYWEVEDNDNDEYVLKDTDYTLRLNHYYENKLKEIGQYDFYKNWLLPKSKLILRAEHHGIRLDVEKARVRIKEFKMEADQLGIELDREWEAAHQTYHRLKLDGVLKLYEGKASAAVDRLKDKSKTTNTYKRYEKLRANALEKIPNMVDYGSSKQLLWLLRDYYGFNCKKINGKISTDAEVLEGLAHQGKKGVRTLLEIRHRRKMIEYIESYLDYQHDGILHPSFNLALLETGTKKNGTRTGRLSSSLPNFQQVTKRNKDLFPANEGNAFVGFDLNSIEANLIALYTSDPVLHNICSKGRSLHNNNVKVFFDVDTPEEEIPEKHPKERDATKKTGFTLFYGGGKGRIKESFQALGFHFSEQKCSALHKQFKDEYKTAIQFHRDITQEFEAGKVIKNLFGRPLRIENPEDAYMKGFNTLIQSSASDLNLEAAQQAQDEFDKRGLKANVILFVHDFLMVEAPKENIEEVNDILKNKMTSFKLKNDLGLIPIGVEGGVSELWSA